MKTAELTEKLTAGLLPANHAAGSRSAELAVGKPSAELTSLDKVITRLTPSISSAPADSNTQTLLEGSPEDLQWRPIIEAMMAAFQRYATPTLKPFRGDPGEDINAFLRQLDAHLESTADAVNKANLVIRYLDGKAKRWWTTFDGGGLSYEDFKEMLREEYDSPVNRQPPRAEPPLKNHRLHQPSSAGAALPRIAIQLRGRPLRALIDTAACHSVIRREHAGRVTHSPVVTATIGGQQSRLPVSGRTRADFTADGQLYRVQCLVAPTLREPIVLGLDWLSKNGAKLNYGTRTCYLAATGQTLGWIADATENLLTSSQEPVSPKRCRISEPVHHGVTPNAYTERNDRLALRQPPSVRPYRS